MQLKLHGEAKSYCFTISCNFLHFDMLQRKYNSQSLARKLKQRFGWLGPLIVFFLWCYTSAQLQFPIGGEHVASCCGSKPTNSLGKQQLERNDWPTYRKQWVLFPHDLWETKLSVSRMWGYSLSAYYVPLPSASACNANSCSLKITNIRNLIQKVT